jgi:hypothetical protein
MYDYEVRRIKTRDLEKTLQDFTGSKWELVSVVPTGETETSPLTAQYVLVIVRRPKPGSS